MSENEHIAGNVVRNASTHNELRKAAHEAVDEAFTAAMGRWKREEMPHVVSVVVALGRSPGSVATRSGETW